MDFGTTYQTIEEVVRIVEERLGVAMIEHKHEEIGKYFSWASDLERQGAFTYYGISIKPTRYWDPEEKAFGLARVQWEPYTFVIGVSDKLTSEIARIRYFISQGILVAEEIPN